MDVIYSFIKNEFNLYCEQFGYTAGVLKALKGFQFSFVKNGETILNTLYYPIVVNCILMNDLSGSALRYLLLEPEMFENCFYGLIRSKIEKALNYESVELEQLILPIVIHPTVTIMEEFPSTKLCWLKGVMMEYSLNQQKFVRTSNWRCEQYCCRLNPPKICKSLPSKPPICDACAAPLKEIPWARNMGYYVTGSIVPSSYLDGSISHCEFKCIPFYIEDARICNSDMILGAEYILVGIYRKETFLVWGCQCIVYVDRPLAQFSPIELRRLQLGNCPWSFVRYLSGIINDATPDGYFSHLTIGLLLSLATVYSENPVPIMAVCEDYEVGLHLMNRAKKLANRYINYNHQFGPLSVRYDDTSKLISGGALTLAQRGVCYLGNWQLYTGKVGTVLKEAIESGSVPVEGIDGITVPIKCVIWSLKEKKWNGNDYRQIKTLVKIFGIILKCCFEQKDDERIADYLLNGCSQRSCISLEELRKYIQSISILKVNLSESASDFLQSYFVRARFARGENLPASSLERLRSLCEAHARLNRRTTALVEDVLPAIQLCENFLGPINAFGAPPEDLSNFRQWLHQYLLVDF